MKNTLLTLLLTVSTISFANIDCSKINLQDKEYSFFVDGQNVGTIEFKVSTEYFPNLVEKPAHAVLSVKTEAGGELGGFISSYNLMAILEKDNNCYFAWYSADKNDSEARIVTSVDGDIQLGGDSPRESEMFLRLEK